MDTNLSFPQGVPQDQYREFNFIFQRLHEAIENVVPGSIHRLLQTDGPAFARTVARRSESGLMTKRLFAPVRKKSIQTDEINPIALQAHNRELLGRKIQQKISEQFPIFDGVLQSKICQTYVDIITSFIETSRDMSLNQNLVSGYIYPKDDLNLATYTGILTGTIEMRKIPQEIAIQASREFMNDFHSQQYHKNDAQKNALTVLVKHLSRFHAGDILKTCREYSLTHAETDRVCASHNRRMLGAQTDTTNDMIDDPLDAPLIRAGVYAAETIGIALRQGIGLVNEVCLQNPRKSVQKPPKKQKIHTNKKNHTNGKNIGSIACEQVGEVVAEEMRNLGNKIRALIDQGLRGIPHMRAKTSQLLDPHPEEDVRGLRSQIGRLLRKKKEITPEPRGTLNTTKEDELDLHEWLNENFTTLRTILAAMSVAATTAGGAMSTHGTRKTDIVAEESKGFHFPDLTAIPPRAWFEYKAQEHAAPGFDPNRGGGTMAFIAEIARWGTENNFLPEIDPLSATSRDHYESALRKLIAHIG